MATNYNFGEVILSALAQEEERRYKRDYLESEQKGREEQRALQEKGLSLQEKGLRLEGDRNKAAEGHQARIEKMTADEATAATKYRQTGAEMDLLRL